MTVLATATYTENLWVLLVPVVLILLTSAARNVPFFGFLILTSVALSVPLSHFYPDMSIDVFLPSEVLILGLLILLALRFLHNRQFDASLLKHPVSVAIVLYLTWMLFTCFTSTMPLVSIKHFMARLWFVIAFYYFAYELFKRKPERITYWIVVFTVSTTLVIFYALGRQYYYGIGIKKIAYWAASPFFKDHTSYGALLAMYLPFLVGFTLSDIYSRWKRVLFGFLALLFLTATIFSYTRAAWVSLMGAFVIYLVVRLRVRIYVWAFILISVIIVGMLLSNNLVFYLEQNKQESSIEISKHVRSIYNISNDISNLERINRWKSAYSMFEEKPIVGFGPGTYMFNYAPFQMFVDKTPISTNSGDLGNAHSEYLGVLSESGIFGLLSFLLIIAYTSVTAVRLYYQLEDKQTKLWVICSYIGLVTYYLHGIVNNFLDTDKISLPFWSFTLIIVFIDLQTKARKKIQVQEE